MSASLSRILVLLDGTDLNQPTVRLAARIAGAQPRAVEVTLLRVIVPPRDAFLPPDTGAAPAVDLAEREADRELRALSRELCDFRVRRAVLVGEQAREVEGWLGEHPVDLAVYAPRRRGRLHRLFAPDRVETALRTAGVPIVIAPEGPHSVHISPVLLSLALTG